MIKRLIPFAKKYKKAFILAFLCVVGETMLTIVEASGKISLALR